MYPRYVALHEVTWCMLVWCTQNTPRWQQFYMAPAMPACACVHVYFLLFSFLQFELLILVVVIAIVIFCLQCLNLDVVHNYLNSIQQAKL